jgi:nucleoside-diphosphate-sugar epimerase
MKIAILGATSQIAQDLILSFFKNKNYSLLLFVRNVELMQAWMSGMNLSGQYQVYTYADFDNNHSYDVVINFVGAGDPAKIQEIGEGIVKVTEQYDNMALDYIKHHKKTKYIFLSSGVVFGGDYQEPVDENTSTDININNPSPMDWYATAKRNAEKKHRDLLDLPIVDIRVFNYFSHTQDMSARLLMADIVRAIKNKEEFKTSPDNVVKDFITPTDFYNFIQAVIDFESINTALDCYTKEPIAKFDLLLELKNKFKLQYEINQSADIIDAARVKMNYYSINKVAGNIGYSPKKNSMDGIIQEIHKYLKSYA